MEVNFAGQYTKQDFLQAQRIHYMPSPVMQVLRIAAIVAVVAIYIAQFFLRQPGRLIDELGILLPAFIIIYVLAMPFLLPFSTTSQMKKNPDFQAPISGTVNEIGVKLVAKRSTSELKWELYSRAIQNDDFVMLYQPNKWYNLFPRRFFSSGSDWNRFVMLVKQKITDRHSTTGEKQPLDYQDAKAQMIDALQQAIASHEVGLFSAIDYEFDRLDQSIPRSSSQGFTKLIQALYFWDCWIDARNHQWSQYPIIRKEDWPEMAKSVVSDLQADREISDEKVFGLWARK